VWGVSYSSQIDLENSDIRDIEPFGIGSRFSVTCEVCGGEGYREYENYYDEKYIDKCRCCNGAGDYYLYMHQDGTLCLESDLLKEIGE
jgi:hypothetical protein